MLLVVVLQKTGESDVIGNREEKGAPLSRLAMSSFLCSAVTDPNMMSISSKLRPLVSGINLGMETSIMTLDRKELTQAQDRLTRRK